MKDFNDTLALDNDDRIASGTLTVTDYEALIGAKSGGTITVNSYAELIGAKAATTITVTAFASLVGKTVTIGTDVLTEGVDFTAAVSNDATATSLAAAIDGLADVAAAAVGAVVTITAAAFGLAGNSIAVATNAAAGITLAEAHLIGGKEHGTITVGADTLVQGTDFTAETSNAVTATNIAAAIDGLADYVSSALAAVVTIEAAAIGTAYNVELSATWNDLADTAVTLSGSMLTGGLDEATVVFNGTTLTQGTNFTAETSNDVTATNIAAAIDALASFGAAAVGAVVTVTADAAGTAGNVAFTSNASGAGITIVAMSGGADYFYSDVFDYAKEKNPSITVTPEVTVLSGGGNVIAVVEVSMNKVDWEVLYTFATFSSATSATKTLTREMNFARVRFSVTGTATVEVRMMTSEFGGDDNLSIDKVGEVAVPTSGADAVSNTRSDLPTSSRISGFNGTTWDRLRAGITAVTSTLTGWLNTLPWAIYHASPTARTEAQGGPLEADASGNLRTAEQFAPAAEDNVAGVIKVEKRYSSSGLMTTDTQVKASAGFVHAITITPTDAAATAGTIDVYDNTSAAGTKIFSTYIPAALIAPVTIILDVSCANGIYVDFTTTADVNVTVSYR